MLITLDEDLNPLPVSVRVGQAVDTVRQAGKPKTITGFQTHTTPVLLARGDRAELATDQCKNKKKFPHKTEAFLFFTIFFFFDDKKIENIKMGHEKKKN